MSAIRDSAAREELRFIKSYLSHQDQDVDHGFIVRRINAVLAGMPSAAPCTAEAPSCTCVLGKLVACAVHDAGLRRPDANPVVTQGCEFPRTDERLRMLERRADRLEERVECHVTDEDMHTPGTFEHAPCGERAKECAVKSSPEASSESDLPSHTSADSGSSSQGSAPNASLAPDETHRRLRGYAIQHGHLPLAPKRSTCGVCNGIWYTDSDEEHASGCVAAPRVAPTPGVIPGYDYRSILEKIARTPGLPVEAYELAADALCWARKFRKVEEPAPSSRVDGPWRVGRKLGRTVYCADKFMALFDEPRMANLVVEKMNEDWNGAT